MYYPLDPAAFDVFSRRRKICAAIGGSLLAVLVTTIVVLAVTLSEHGPGPAPPGSSCRVLILGGGGSRGIYEVGVISQILEKNPGISWDLITGVSAGSLNAVMLASQKDLTIAASMLADMWLNITTDQVYAKYLFPINHQSIYDTSPFNATLHRYLEPHRPIVPLRNVTVLSSSLNTGLPVLFGVEDIAEDPVAVMMASSAVPILFPPVYFKGQVLVDGGLLSNELVAPALELCDRPILDVVVCSETTKFANTSELQQNYLYGIAKRVVDVATNNFFNHQIFERCSKKGKNYVMNLYVPAVPLKGNMLTFDRADMLANYQTGKTTAAKQLICSGAKKRRKNRTEPNRTEPPPIKH
ncbi:MAG: patatin-like phospholipase family protein [Sulfobacillus sp.]